MITFTTTSTNVETFSAQPDNIVQVASSPKAPTGPLAIIMEFGALLIKHGANQDPVSQNLVAAGKTFLVYALQNHAKPFDAILRGGVEKIEEIKKILINPLTKSTFKNPWLVESIVTWDEATLTEHQGYARRFSNNGIDAVPHTFIREAINWIDRLPKHARGQLLLGQDSVRETNQSLMISTVPKEVRDYQRYLLYEHIIAQSKEKQQGLMVLKEFKEMNTILEKENVEGFKRLEQIVERRQQSNLEETDELKRNLNALAIQQEKTRALLKKENGLQKKDLDEAMTILKKVQTELNEAHIQMNRQQAQINDLCNQLHSSCSQVNYLRNELNNADSDSGCSIM